MFMNIRNTRICFTDVWIFLQSVVVVKPAPYSYAVLYMQPVSTGCASLPNTYRNMRIPSLVLYQYFSRENPSFSVKLTSACESKYIPKKKKKNVILKYEKKLQICLLFLCFSVTFKPDIKTYCLIWGETTMKLIGSQIFLKELVSRQVKAEESSLILWTRIYIHLHDVMPFSFSVHQ